MISIGELHDVAVGSKVKVIIRKHYLGTLSASVSLIDNDILTYDLKDVMYAICTDSKGNKVKVPGWTRVELIEEPLSESE